MNVFGLEEHRSLTKVFCMTPEGKTTSGCEQDWVSLGDSLDGTLQMPNLRHAIFLLLSLCKVTSLYKGSSAGKQEADWKTGRERVDQ